MRLLLVACFLSVWIVTCQSAKRRNKVGETRNRREILSGLPVRLGQLSREGTLQVFTTPPPPSHMTNPPPNIRPMQFTRVVNHGNTAVIRFGPRTTNLKRIEDFVAESLANSYIQVTFTSPGRDPNTDRRYQICYTFDSRDALTTNFTNMCIENIPMPKLANSTESFRFLLPDSTRPREPYRTFLAIRMVNNSSKTSPLSDIVSIDHTPYRETTVSTTKPITTTTQLNEATTTVERFPTSPIRLATTVDTTTTSVTESTVTSQPQQSTRPIVDIIPPSRITNFAAVKYLVRGGTQLIRVKFASPGNNGHFGRASRYLICYSWGSSHRLQFNFLRNCIPNLPRPKYSGQSEDFTFPAPTANRHSRTMYMAIKAMDELSNIAPTSNIVRIMYERRTASTSRTRCKECNGVRSLEECDRRGTVKTCQRQDVCSMEVRINGGRRTISVFCKQKQACKNELRQNNQQCRRNMQNKTCRCCCEKPSCNASNFTCITTYNNFQ